MNAKKLLALVLALVLVCSLAACSLPGKDKMATKDKDKGTMQSGMMDEKDMESKDGMLTESACMCGEDSKCMTDGMCAKDGCGCMKDGMCTDMCMCMDNGCMKDGICVDDCMCGKADMSGKDMNNG